MLRNLNPTLIDSLLKSSGNVSSLNLSKNGIRNIQHIERLGHCLKKLNLSNNEIVDIGPLAGLPLLKELHLGENDIEDLGPLSSLSELELLDVSGNKLTSMECMQVGLAGMTSLRCIKLSGNLLTTCPGYPARIFAMQKSIMLIDDWQREKFMDSPEIEKHVGGGDSHGHGALLQKQQQQKQQQPKQQQSARNMHFCTAEEEAQASRGTAVRDGESADAEVRSLRAQLKAMDDAFALQERALSANGRDLAQLCAALSLSLGRDMGRVIGKTATEQQQQQTGVMSAASAASAAPAAVRAGMSGGVGPDPDPALTPRTALEQFPYFRLLQLWRKQCQDCLLARAHSERRMARSAADMKRDRQVFAAQLQEQEAHALMWRQRSAALDQRCQQLEQTQQEHQEQLVAVQARAQHSERESQRAVSAVRRLAAFLQHAKEAVDNHLLQQRIEQARALEHLQRHEQRLAAAAERLAFATAAVAQKEVQLRNSIAAADAERRLVEWIRLEQAGQHEHSDRAPSSGEGCRFLQEPPEDGEECAGELSALAGAPLRLRVQLSDLAIEAEAEALLRTVHRSLDPEDTGSVPVRLLLECTLAAYGGMGQESAPLPRPGPEGEGEDEGEGEGIEEQSGKHVQKGTMRGVRSSSSCQASSASRLQRPEQRRRQLSETILGMGDGEQLLLEQLSGKRGQWQGQRQREIDEEVNGRKEEEEVRGVEGGADGMLTPLGVLLSRALGPDRLLWLLQALLRLYPDSTLTWGELLAHLIPSPQCLMPRSQLRLRSTLSAQELQELQEAGLVGDLAWGLVPLAQDIVSNPAPLLTRRNYNHSHRHATKRQAPSNSAGKGAGLSHHQQHNHLHHNHHNHQHHDFATEELDEQVARLTAERAYLMRQLQAMGRALERRAEGIKSYFEGALRRSRLQSERQQRELVELRDALAVAERRAQEQTALHQEVRQRGEQRLEAAEQDLQRLKAALSTRQRDEAARYEGLLQQEAARLARLETEYNLCQREAGKKEVRCRALQRDLLRVQAAQAAQTAELQEAHQTLRAVREQQAQQEAQAEQHTEQLRQESDAAAAEWAAEKIALTERIAELQAALLSAQALKQQQALEAPTQEVQAGAGGSDDREDAAEAGGLDGEGAVISEVRAQMEAFRRQYGAHAGAGSGAGAGAGIDIGTDTGTGSKETICSTGDSSSPTRDSRAVVPSERPTRGPTPTVPQQVPQAAMAAHLSKLLRLAEQAMT